MTSPERVFTTLEGGQADRVPLMELTIDPGIVEQLLPGGDLFDLIEHLDLDVVPIGIMLDRRPVEWVDHEQRIFRDKWGALQRLTTEVMPIPWHPARLETDADLEDYVAPSGNDEYFLEMTRQCVARFKGQKAISFVGEEVFAVQQYLRGGMENLMVDFATRPAFVKRLAKIGVEYYVELYRRVIAEGVDIILLGDDYAWKMGPFMSPRHFEEYILPGFTQVVQEIRRAGAYCIKHTDGDIWKIMDMMAGAGLHAFGPLEPLPSMDLATIKAHFGGKLAVVGNIDVDLLCRGTTDQVVAATKHLLNTASVGGGHIMSSGNSIISAVKPENYLAMVATTKEFGVYG